MEVLNLELLETPEQIEFEKDYSTQLGTIRISLSNYYNKKTFFIIMLDGNYVASYKSFRDCVEALKRLLKPTAKRGHWL